MKKIFLILLILVLVASGCFEKDLCEELEYEMQKKNINCECVRTDYVPEDYRNLSVEAKCSCMCYTENGWINTTIAVAD